MNFYYWIFWFKFSKFPQFWKFWLHLPSVVVIPVTTPLRKMEKDKRKQCGPTVDGWDMYEDDDAVHMSEFRKNIFINQLIVG